MVDIKNLIAAVSPDVYCDKSVRKKVKDLIASQGYLAAAKEAKLVESTDLFSSDFSRESPLKAPNPIDAPALKAPVLIHKLVYDSPSESLEPVYFWILDFLNNAFKKVDKLVDNFVSSPGSAHFSEIGMKATKMQEEAMKSLGAINQVLKSILNIIYDLKEFKLRLDLYDKYKKGSQEERKAAFLSLKQIWLDNVDIKRGNTSIKGMSQQFDYITLIDAFMAANSLNMVEKELDLNERVKRIILSRLSEFLKWIEESEFELRKRYEIERHYLKSQYNSIKLYSRWSKPYLEAARKLEQNLSPDAALVTTFNTILLELKLLAQNEYKPDDDVSAGELPNLFKSLKKRKYYSIVLVEFKFRGLPQRVGQGYSFGGRVEVVFTGFSLNEQEIKVLKEQIEKDDFKEVLQWVENSTGQSLREIEKEIEDFLGERKEDKKEKKDEDVNPFSALFSFFSKKEDKKEKKDEDLSKGIRPDDRYEKVFRSQAIISARDMCKTLFETYKKAHQMPAF